MSRFLFSFRLFLMIFIQKVRNIFWKSGNFIPPSVLSPLRLYRPLKYTVEKLRTLTIQRCTSCSLRMFIQKDTTFFCRHPKSCGRLFAPVILKGSENKCARPKLKMVITFYLEIVRKQNYHHWKDERFLDKKLWPFLVLPVRPCFRNLRVIVRRQTYHRLKAENLTF